MPGRQKTGAPVDDATGGESSFVRKDNKGWKVVGFATQPISYPRSHAWKSRQDLSGIHHEVTRAVQGRFTLHRIYESHVVHTGGELGEQITHPDAGLTVSTEFPKTRLAITGFGSEEL